MDSAHVIKMTLILVSNLGKVDCATNVSRQQNCYALGLADMDDPRKLDDPGALSPPKKK